ncbi:hypothetical protein [Dyadobacter sp. 50-39]|uniref:hypothetical protein n=1 Tax=Dyadobacter sp. 50-39 TaxID=1895756 RepID=UPI000A6D71ED|nr:hypothetical protein [Dyadobacter sp. 50-39]
MMTIQLISGEFPSTDAVGLISEMIQVKIKYHEQKIDSIMNEEDIKNRERKIKSLHQTLADVKKLAEGIPGKVSMESQVTIG